MFGFKKCVYLDYASATPVLPEALRAEVKAEAVFANPGSLHSDGVEAMRYLSNARENIAGLLGCKGRQLVVTSGLTESNNLAILGFARRLEFLRSDLKKSQGRTLENTHWITSSIEHSSVLEAFGEVERLGGTVTFLEPDTGGTITPEVLERALRPETVFISIGWANNEIGVVQPLRALTSIVRTYEKQKKISITFHSDAGQAPLYLSPQVHTLGVDMLSLGSGKLYGPRGVGVLYVRNTSSLAPILLGGGQEAGLRAGTEKVAPLVGFAKALQVITHERAREVKRLEKMRNELARSIVAHIPEVLVNGDLKHVLPHMLNISVPGEKSGEYLALQLDRAGISLSTKSACDEGNLSSNVVEALGGPVWRARNTLRISLGRGTKEKELTFLAQMLIKITRNLPGQ